MDLIKKAVKVLENKGYEFNQDNRLRLTNPEKRTNAEGVEYTANVPNGRHRLTLLKAERITNYKIYTSKTTSKEVVGIRFTFKDGDSEKYYEIPLLTKEDKPHYLLKHFEDLEAGDVIDMEAKPGGQGIFIEVSKVVSAEPVVQLDETDKGSVEGGGVVPKESDIFDEENQF